jgi:hypothetical protein
MTLSQFIHQLTAGDVVPANDPQQRWHPQVIHETDEEEYDYYLDMLPPRYISGSYVRWNRTRQHRIHVT